MIFLISLLAILQSFVGSYTVYAIYQRIQASKPVNDPYQIARHDRESPGHRVNHLLHRTAHRARLPRRQVARV